MVLGNQFPRIEAKTLSDKKIVLPDDILGEYVLLAVAFVRGAQPMLDEWIKIYKDICEKNPAYEIPMIDGVFWKLLSRQIDEGMRSGIPEKKHDHVVTYYGDTKEYAKKLGIREKTKGYVYLLDPEGKIIFMGSGFPSEQDKKKLEEKISNIC